MKWIQLQVSWRKTLLFVLAIVCIGAFFPYEKMRFIFLSPLKISVLLKPVFAGGGMTPIQATGLDVVPQFHQVSHSAEACIEQLPRLVAINPYIPGVWQKLEISGQTYYRYVFESGVVVPRAIQFSLKSSDACGEIGAQKYALTAGTWVVALSGPHTSVSEVRNLLPTIVDYDQKHEKFEVVLRADSLPEPFSDTVAYQLSPRCKVELLNCNEVVLNRGAADEMKLGPFSLLPETQKIEIFFKSELNRTYVRPLVSFNTAEYFSSQARVEVHSKLIEPTLEEIGPSGFLKTPVRVNVVLTRSKLASQMDPNPQIEIKDASIERLSLGAERTELEATFNELGLLPGQVVILSKSSLLGEFSAPLDPFKEWLQIADLAPPAKGAYWKVTGGVSSKRRLQDIASKKAAPGFRREDPNLLAQANVFIVRNPVLHGVSKDQKSILHAWSKQAVLCRNLTESSSTLGFLSTKKDVEVESAFECDRTCRPIAASKVLSACSIGPEELREISKAEQAPYNCGKCGSDIECQLNCFPVCERWGGWGSQTVIRNCDKCKGDVVTISDSGPADGITLRICIESQKRGKSRN